MKMYLLHLAGDGDIQLRIVDQETWDWIDSMDKAVPGAITERELAWQKADWGDQWDGHVNVSDTCEETSTNDRALAVPPCQHPDGTWMSFVYLKDYVKFLQEHPDIEIVSEYEGVIY